MEQQKMTARTERNNAKYRHYIIDSGRKREIYMPQRDITGFKPCPICGEKQHLKIFKMHGKYWMGCHLCRYYKAPERFLWLLKLKWNNPFRKGEKQ